MFVRRFRGMLGPAPAYTVKGVRRMIGFCELRRKEVINVRDGARLGCICDLEIECESGLIKSLVVPGPPHFFGLLKNDEELVIPYSRISKIGGDVILVDIVL